MAKTSIEWATDVWNPVTGCNKVSQGCKHCYAETIAERFWAKQYPPNPDGSPRKFTDVRVHPERLEDPLKWRKPRRVFVNSMSDLFHPSVPFEYVADVFDVMADDRCEHHTFQILTKRPKRIMEFLSWSGDLLPGDTPMNVNLEVLGHFGYNVWLGVSVEDQETADERIPSLLQTPAAVRFVSYEPALGPVDFKLVRREPCSHMGCFHHVSHPCEGCGYQAGRLPIDWIIMGGESGPGARPMHPDWVRSTRDQCQAAGVPFFFKQWGEWMPVCPQYQDDNDEPGLDELDMMAHTICLGNKGTLYREDRGLKEEYWCGYQPDPWQNPWFLERVGKKAAGRMLDGRTWNEFPEVK